LHDGQRLKYKKIDDRPMKEEIPSRKSRIIRVRQQPVTHPWKSPARAMAKARSQRQAVSQNQTF
ncbi:MAG TPA: hypothetical protein VL122_10885, partial [Nitrospirota bacterium]|nr:hypothetical protein [Nitrospirota bacterium]